ncbi:heparinase II/III family protein [Noviherbaspirillum autotrophicum]|uniref:Uncharacterized protein n=1 Tax=Noviherbaspirillum autotrophicum TaxID=709839 RepID=A0A0C1YAZ6_9BURK|nr:heparinase II/III family protein [Noviherbaspirillum autotrophicum]KIF82713.1 hypothetical protein TSA66_20795 [Noviherbaspirillum autotrophicum]KIF84163.1 hypothetical protein TSA66_00065 [Noviherbaspirillum autotrophicum]
MTSLSLLFHTVRHLRVKQIVYRLLMRIREIRITPTPAPALAIWSASWNAPTYKLQSLFPPVEFSLLNETHAITTSADWDRPEWSQLWRYNLHYFDDLDSIDAQTRHTLQQQWIQRWIAENPAPRGTGWDAYPLSLRIVNWIKWGASGGSLDQCALDSLALQTRVLAQKLEYHLLANHLFVNAKALIFSGARFAGPEADAWMRKGLAILDDELHEQFLADGAHFELSPMYHCALLWDLLDMLYLARISGNIHLQAKEKEWRVVASRALSWMNAMCLGDDQISFFNDAAFDIAPEPRVVREYASLLEVQATPQKVSNPVDMTMQRLADSGYVRIDWPDATAILDVARVGANYQPGHAHADTLSFELSLGSQRVFVNTGTSQYGTNSERQRQRGTAAHTTVIIDDFDSSEVWAGFRVARRAYPIGYAEDCANDHVRVTCAHNGFMRLRGSPIHRRTWDARAKTITVTDQISGKFRRAQARYHLHPDLRAAIDSDVAILVLPDERSITVQAEGGTMALEASTWHPKFGVSCPTLCLTVTFSGPQVTVTAHW